LPSGENPQQITFGENSNETFPQVSPDGEYLYFIRKEKQSSAVWRKSLASGAEEKITDEKQFSPANILALSPDGKYLGFHNVTDQINPENIAQIYQIAVIEIANPQAVRFFSIAGSKQEIYWTHDSTAFDYIEHQQGRSDGVFRIKLDGESGEQVVKSFPNEAAFFITRSPDGKTTCISHGQSLYDAVLLTNFE
jgi:Tol biopolymer transport system component